MARLRGNTRLFCEALEEAGVKAASASAIVPIVIGDEGRAVAVAQCLYEEGIFLSAIRYPTVARGSARLRAALMATHTEGELKEAAEKIARAIREA